MGYVFVIIATEKAAPGVLPCNHGERMKLEWRWESLLRIIDEGFEGGHMNWGPGGAICVCTARVVAEQMKQ